MNDKRAKLLRLEARKASVGMPARCLLGKKHERVVIIDGKPAVHTEIQAVNDPNSTRGIYRRLKRGLSV